MLDDGSGEEDHGEILAGRVLAQGAGAIVGLTLGGPPGGILGAMATPIFEEVATQGIRNSLRSVKLVIEIALGVARMESLDAVRVIQNDGDRFMLTATALQAAMSTLDEQKLNALAHALGEGLADDARLDMSIVVVRALADLEPPHIRILNAFVNERCSDTQGVEIPSGAWTLTTLQTRFPNLHNGVLSIMATLVRHGLVRDGLAVTQTDFAWKLTQFGVLCLHYLEKREARASGRR